jgi:signal transduction histidine kinase
MTESNSEPAEPAGGASGRDDAGTAPVAALPREAARKLAHDLRTPLSAMAGWIHLLESGALDEAGKKRALAKLRGNIEDQVKTIERYLGAPQEGQN